MKLLQLAPEARVVACVREPGQVCGFIEALQAVRFGDLMARPVECMAQIDSVCGRFYDVYYPHWPRSGAPCA